ncbi:MULTISPECIES: hypothetical protein [Salinibaculum]|uniref:hypothetical protein n=1 Tax=Salinibaculum TaxID=2732368 RepID=UPI0030CECBA6
MTSDYDRCMSPSELLAALRDRSVDCRFCLGAAAMLLLATVAIVYGLTNQDTVTAVGALLLVPAAVLLAALGLSDREGRDKRRPS